MSTPRIAVTGAAGQLGHALIDLLSPAPVLALDLVDRPGWAPPSVEWVTGDVQDGAHVRSALDGIEVVHHLASVGSISPRTATSAWRVNVRGARVVADAALQAGVGRFVHCSSARAFDATATARSIDETTPRSRGDAPVYNRSKAAGEASVRRRIVQGLDVVVVHPSGVLGPHLAPDSLVGQFLVRLAEGSLATLVHGFADWVDSRDVAASLAGAADRGRTGESYLLGGTFSSLSDLARIVAAESHRAGPRRCLPAWVAGALAGVAQATGTTVIHPHLTPDAVRAIVEARPVNSGKARRELGHHPRPLDETVRDTLASLRPSAAVPSISV
jgi:dihydroflavonol-4-reductase